MKKNDMKTLLTFIFCSLSLFVIGQNGTIEAEDGLKLGNTTSTTNGTVRYTGSDFEGRVGGIWESLTNGGSSVWDLNGTSAYYNGGKVGIGIASPLSSLHVYGGDGASGVNPNGFVRQLLEDNTQVFSEIDATTWAGFTFAGSGQSLRAGMLYNYANDDIMFRSGGIDGRLVINPNGYIGIGTSTPAKHLDLATSGADIRFSNSNFSAIQWYEGATEVAYLTHNANDVILQNSDTGNLNLNSEDGRVRMSSTGDITIGTTIASPTYELREDGAGATRNAAMELNNYNFTGANKTAILLDTEGSNNEPFVILYGKDGIEEAIKLDADVSGKSRITVDEVLIKGGADFAENFDILEEDILPSPGMVVSIDANSTGKLTITSEKYDRKVAGIISGANGVESGLMMGQTGSIADGDYPVALTGRVYVYANNENGKIVPGDLLTTSSQKGYAMRVSDFDKAQGAVIGKAMTEVDDKGFVLVLVNLQ
jgi:hypothetical protein